jgi:hypothetical protein
MGTHAARQPGWSPGQRILNDADAREPEHRLDPPVPVVARFCGKTTARSTSTPEAAGWSGQLVYVRVPDTRHRLTLVWLAASDVERR